ncbi:MFS transporter [Alicyclobacillus sp. SO9]|uniref:MFS transporter n=1 Tax=Alicyclobacillus sp. SO9 TaxID=2665646 RepID=UPI0018E77180|nr:MFS transporter [Alicyclobacillus sp. SO9]QQE78428.1 MFS transporter [Alicyclobacillus sp. SO9]
MKSIVLWHPLQPFTSPQFRLLWGIITFANAGQWTFLLVSGWQTYTLTQSSAWTGAMVLAVFAPNLIGSPIGGVLVDKFNRKQVLTGALLFATGINVLLGLMSFARHLTPTTLFVFTLLYGISLSLLGVSTNTLVPVSVTPNQLFHAVYLQSIAQRGAEFLGPALASSILAKSGPGAVYIFTAILYISAILLTALLPSNGRLTSPLNDGSGFTHLLKEGVGYVMHSGQLRKLISFTSLHCILTMAYIGLLPTFVSVDVRAHSGFYGALLAYAGLGAIVGILFLTMLGTAMWKDGMLWITALLSSLSLIALSVSVNPLIVSVSVFSAGLAQGMFMALVVAMIQEMTDESFRGRVNSFYLVVTAGLMSVANWGFGALGTLMSESHTFGLMGFAFLMVVMFFWTRIRRFSGKNEGKNYALSAVRRYL